MPALDCGFRASAAFPLRRQGRVIGALTLYSPNKGAFDPAQIRLLEALCADVSYAIGAMEQERLRSDAEQALRESESSLRDVDRRKNEFLAVLSHELRNPLTPIRNSLHILDRAVPGGDQARRAHNVIDRQVGHLSRLVDDLLDMTRISSNKIRLDRQVLDLNDLVRRSVDDHRSLFEKNGIQVEVTLAPERASVDGDGTRLAQVVGNLLQNAANFTGRGGHTGASVAVDPTERHATIRVTDTGVGMAPDVLARLFQPFMQADTSLDRSKGGLGLGLALIEGLVELHGGTIGAHSDGLGKGAQFVERPPLAPEGVVLAEAGRANVHQAHRRVLIIEDNIDAASSLREVLELGEHQVAVAHNGTDGLAKAREFRAAGGLCDIGLPGMDGYEVARAFRVTNSGAHSSWRSPGTPCPRTPGGPRKPVFNGISRSHSACKLLRTRLPRRNRKQGWSSEARPTDVLRNRPWSDNRHVQAGLPLRLFLVLRRRRASRLQIAKPPSIALCAKSDPTWSCPPSATLSSRRRWALRVLPS